METSFFIYVAIMAGVTYLIRMLPLVLFQRKIENRFIKSFLFYVPFAALAAMTFPAIFHSTGSIPSAVAALMVALVMAFKGRSLVAVAGAACLTAFVVEMLLR